MVAGKRGQPRLARRRVAARTAVLGDQRGHGQRVGRALAGGKALHTRVIRLLIRRMRASLGAVFPLKGKHMHQAAHVRQTGTQALHQAQQKRLARPAVEIHRQPQNVCAARKQPFLVQLSQCVHKGAHAAQHPQHGLLVTFHGGQHRRRAKQRRKALRLIGQQARRRFHIREGWGLRIAPQLGGQRRVQRRHAVEIHQPKGQIGQLLLQAVGMHGGIRQRHKRRVHQGRAAISDCGRHSTSLGYQRHLPLLCSILPYYITKIPQVKQSPRLSCMRLLLRV